MSLRLFVALQLVGRDNVSAEHGWAKITEVLNQCTPRQILDAPAPSELVLPGGLVLSGDEMYR